MNQRTLLLEHVREGSDNPLDGGYYSVVAKKFIGLDGFTSQIISSEVIDDHYLISVSDTYKIHITHRAVAVIDIGNPKAADRMYQEAKKVAMVRAELDLNQLLDLTSNSSKISEDDRYFVPTGFFHHKVA